MNLDVVVLFDSVVLSYRFLPLDTSSFSRVHRVFVFQWSGSAIMRRKRGNESMITLRRPKPNLKG